MRLQPDEQDGYGWAVLPASEHLFRKQLSKHSVRAYMELCREVGKSFEAVAPRDIDPGSNPTVSSFCLTIKHLMQVNAGIQGELMLRKETAREEAKAWQGLEAECHESLLKLSKACEETERLKSENRHLRTQLRNHCKNMRRSQLQTNEVIRAFQTWSRTIKQDANSEDGDITNTRSLSTPTIECSFCVKQF